MTIQSPIHLVAPEASLALAPPSEPWRASSKKNCAAKKNFIIFITNFTC